MKAIINGKRYDTETAELVGDGCSDAGRGDFNYWSARLYKTKKGTFFLAGEGGARSLFAKPCGNNGSQGGSGIVPMDDEAARDWAERHLDAAVVETFFTIEDA
jgi:hypothetical protein